MSFNALMSRTSYCCIASWLCMLPARRSRTSYLYAWRGWHSLDVPGRSWSSYEQAQADTCTLALQLFEKELDRPYDGCCSYAQQRLDLISWAQFVITHTAHPTHLQVPAAA